MGSLCLVRVAGPSGLHRYHRYYFQ